ncbi:MAG: hypothetical protein V3W44_02250 [Dehalococcoidales bacterium]
MKEKDAMFELWRAADDLMSQMQALASGHNQSIQEVEQQKEAMADSVTRVMDKPDWNYVPACGEVSIDTELNEVMKHDRRKE